MTNYKKFGKGMNVIANRKYIIFLEKQKKKPNGDCNWDGKKFI